MDDQIVAIFTLTSDFLSAMRHYEDPQCRMSDAEVMTTALVAALYFRGNFELARSLLKQRQYIPCMLSRSRLNRRLHRIRPKFLSLFAILAQEWKALNKDSIYVIDSFPIAACDNYRIKRNKLYGDKAFHGYIASKRRYFFGLRVHIMVTQSGEPVEFFLAPGSFADVSALKLYDYDLPPASIIYGDRAYNDYQWEDIVNEAGLNLIPVRRKNSLRPHPSWIHHWQHVDRKMVETAASMIERKLPKSIHAVTPAGFELKVVLFVLSLSVSQTLG